MRSRRRFPAAGFRVLHGELARTNGHVLWLGALIAELETGDLKQRALGNDTLLWDRPSVWLELYQAERRHLVAVSAAAIKAGVEERGIWITQEQGAMIARALRGILDELGVSEHPDLPPVVRRHLMLVAGPPADADTGA